MPQLHLPLFPSGATTITAALSFCRTDNTVTYFHCGMPVFSHDQDDRASIRLIIAQLHVTSGAKQADLARAFGIPQITIKRAVKQYRNEGMQGFFAPRVTRGAAVLTEPVLQQAQSQLDAGQTPAPSRPSWTSKPTPSSKPYVLGDCAHGQKKNDTARPGLTEISTVSDVTSKSARSDQDSTAPMGRGACNVGARVASSLGALSAVAPQF